MQGQQRQYQLYIPGSRSNDKQIMPVVFLLQGFDSVIIADHTKHLFWEFCQAADRHRFVLVMPRGLKGSFDEIPEVIAWYPEYFADNLRYLQELPEYLRQDPGNRGNFDLDNIYFIGYSNAAYFGAIALMNYPQMPFKGYWLEAGGFPYAFNPEVPRTKVFLNAGKNDLYNIGYIRKLAEVLPVYGWQSGDNFIYNEHPGTHIFDFSAIDRAISFLFEPAQTDKGAKTD